MFGLGELDLAMRGTLINNIFVVTVATGFPDHIPVTIDQDEAVDVVQVRDGDGGAVGLLDDHRALG